MSHSIPNARRTLSVAMALTALLTGALFATQARAASVDLASWAGAVTGNLEFLDLHAWDEQSGSYASDLDVEGKRTTDNRYPVALGRMIYANAHAPGAARNLERARRSADFLLEHMSARDARGLYFKSSVDSKGREVPSGRGYSFSFEQSYPIAGLIALYSVAPERNADLLPVIREAARSYWSRFHDPDQGGLFYYYNFARGDHSNDSGETHKSYQSTVYPVSSFLLALRDADPEYRELYDGWIREALAVAVEQLIERKSGGEPTGWLIERADASFRPDEGYRMTEAGHITQLAWVLGVASERGILGKPGDSEAARLEREYLDLAGTLLSKLLANGGLSATGAVYDAFDRATGKAWAGSDNRPTSAWWSTLEAVIAYDFAAKRGLVAGAEAALEKLSQAYFDHFVDHERGGEYFRIDSETGAVVDGTKGGPGKSGYHITEAYLYLSAGWTGLDG